MKKAMTRYLLVFWGGLGLLSVANAGGPTMTVANLFPDLGAALEQHDHEQGEVMAKVPIYDSWLAVLPQGPTVRAIICRYQVPEPGKTGPMEQVEKRLYRLLKASDALIGMEGSFLWDLTPETYVREVWQVAQNGPRGGVDEVRALLFDPYNLKLNAVIHLIAKQKRSFVGIEDGPLFRFYRSFQDHPSTDTLELYGQIAQLRLCVAAGKMAAKMQELHLNEGILPLHLPKEDIDLARQAFDRLGIHSEVIVPD